MVLWVVPRSSAFIACACYTISVAWGISLTARSFRPPVAPQFDYHRFVAMLGFLALCTHVGTLMFDKFAGIHPKTLLGIHTPWEVLLGVIAFWIAIALPFSFHLKQRKILVNQKFWRNFHYLGYSVWALSLIHGIAKGTDTGSVWALAAYGTAAAIIGGVAWWRWFEAPLKARKPARTTAPTEAAGD
jgi:hypothetical protein